MFNHLSLSIFDLSSTSPNYPSDPSDEKHNYYSSLPSSPVPSYTSSKLYADSTSSSTNTSTLSLALSSYPEKYNESDPPPYTYVFYNTFEDKPLPPLPCTCEGKMDKKVRFVVEKPLPALPVSPSSSSQKDNGREGENGAGFVTEAKRIRMRARNGSLNGEYAWWTKRWSMSDEEYERVAREKEGGGLVTKFREEFD